MSGWGNEDAFVASFKREVRVTYCDWSVALLVEYFARAAYRKSSGVSIAGVLVFLLKRNLRKFITWRGRDCFSTAGFWKGGDIVLLPSIDNHVRHMEGLAGELAKRGKACSYLIKIGSAFRNKLSGIIHEVPSCHHVSAMGERILVQYCREYRRIKFSCGAGFLRRLYLFFLIKDEVRRFLATIEAARSEMSRNRPCCLISGRPKNVHPLAFLVAAKLEGVKTFFLSHTTWFEYAHDKPDLYDLRCFDAAFLYSTLCEKSVRSRNSKISIKVNGIAGGGGKRDVALFKDVGRLRIGYPAGKDYENIKHISEVTDVLGCSLFIKGHPPSGDKLRLLEEVQSRCYEVVVYDHNEIKLLDFIQSVDVILCGKSNVGLEAAQLGVPVVYYLCPNEKLIFRRRKRALEASNVALFQCSDSEELLSTLSFLCSFDNTDFQRLRSSQANAYDELMPVYNVVAMVDFLLEEL